MRFILFAFLGLLLLINLTACENFFESVIKIDVPEHNPKLTIAANFASNSDLLLVQVTHSQGIIDNEQGEILDKSIVELYEGQNIIRSFKYYSSSIYRAKAFSFSSNQIYTLKVSDIDYGSLESSQLMLDSVPIISASYEENGIIDRYGDRGDEIALSFEDQANEKNFYTIQVFPILQFQDEDTMFVIKTQAILSPVDPILEDTRLERELIMSDVSFNGLKKELKLAAFIYQKDEPNYTLTHLEILLYNVSEDRYLFEKTLNAYEKAKDNPFAEPVIVHENVDNGNGIFTISSGASFTIKL